MNPFCVPFAINNMGGAMLAMDVGFMGPNYSISTACATGNYCILRSAAQGTTVEGSVLRRGGWVGWARAHGGAATGKQRGTAGGRNKQRGAPGGPGGSPGDPGGAVPEPQGGQGARPALPRCSAHR